MLTGIIGQLKELRTDSGVRLIHDVVVRIKVRQQSRWEDPKLLVKSKMIHSLKYITMPTNGAQSLTLSRSTYDKRRIATLSYAQGSTLISAINTGLLGGKNNPVLMAILGGAAGFAGIGVGLFLSATATGVGLSKTSHRVLAREGDEIWKIEQIGKIRDGAKYKAVYVNAYFLVDPFRKQTTQNGWLIHEERSDLVLE